MSEAPEKSASLERALAGETVRLRPSRKKWALVLLASVVFSVFCVPWALLEPSVLSVAGALLFGMGVVVSVWAFVPGGMYLRIGPDGLFVKQPFRSRAYAWDDVENFQVYEVHSRYSTQRFVGFDLRDLTPEKQSFWQTMSRGMSGVDVGLPDTYGEDAKRLAKTLGKLRRRYATEHGESPSHRADRALDKRARAVRTDRRVVVTWIVAALCVAAYVFTAVRHGLSPMAGDLVEIGGASGESPWWSVVAGNFLHADLFHILLNLAAWGIAGHLLESEIGAARMAALCAVASLASMGLAILLHPDVVTVGLSGIVFAAMTWGVMRDLHRTRTLGTVMWAMLPVGVIYTFLVPGISIGGHLGGMAAGFLVGRVLDPSRGQ